jgi:membrane associated rhomboid family serine protease
MIVSFIFCRLRLLGALEKDLVVGENEAWRFFTCMFLHAGVVHLLANMFSLLFIGVRLENEFGFRKHIYQFLYYFSKLKLFVIFV